MGHDANMPVLDHVQEFRRRLIIILVVIAIASAISYSQTDTIIALISAPAGKLYFLNPAEVFFSYLKVSVFTGFLVTLPITLWQIWRFVAPALTDRETRLFIILVPVATILFYLGLAFSFFLVLPLAIQFFMGFATSTLLPMFSLESYLSFFITFTLPFGIAFELPIVLIVLGRLGIIDVTFLKRKQKAFIVIAFIFAAVISPTGDIFTQTMIAIPMIILYELSILFMRL